MTASRESAADVELVARARAGERDALARLFERHRERLLGRIRLMLGEPARREAESLDFLQGLFVALLEAAPAADFADEAGFLCWATAVARNDVRDAGKKRRERALDSLSRGLSRAAPATPSADSPAGRALRADEQERLFLALEELRPEDREVIELRDLEGLPFREIARRMDRPSEGAAQAHHARALARLARHLG